MCPYFWPLLASDIQSYTEADVTLFLPLLAFDIQFYTEADVSPFVATINLWH